MKIIRIRSYSGQHFPAFEKYGEIHRISPFSFLMREMWTRITPDTDTNTFYEVLGWQLLLVCDFDLRVLFSSEYPEEVLKILVILAISLKHNIFFVII